MPENTAPAVLDTATTENTTASTPDTAVQSFTNYTEQYAAHLEEKARKEWTRNVVLWTVGVIVAIVGAFMITNAVNKANKLEASQIDAAQKFGDDRGWNHTGRWYVDNVGTVNGYVSFGSCVFNVYGHVDRLDEIVVSLPNGPAGSTSNNNQYRSTRPFLMAALSAEQVKANRYSFFVWDCQLGQPNS